jgi:hypothetical protein
MWKQFERAVNEEFSNSFSVVFFDKNKDRVC